MPKSSTCNSTLSLDDSLTFKQRDGHTSFPRRCDTGSKARGTRQDIAWNAFCLTVPILLLSIALLVLVFGYRIHVNDPPYPDLDVNLPDTITDDAYYVNRSSTIVIFFASWMSSLAPMTTGFAVTLAAYPIAGRLLEDTMQQHKDRLLTPFQLALTLKLLNGSSWSALWSMILYRFGWGHQSGSQGRVLKSLLRVTLVILFLRYICSREDFEMSLIGISALVFGADTWLHLSTRTVSLVQVSSVPSQEASYSVSLIPDCTATNNTIDSLYDNNLNCTIVPHQTTVIDMTAAIQTLTDRSENLSILTDGPDLADAYLSLPISKQSVQQDFTATTIGLHTQCKPITQECHINNTQNSMSYNCSRADGWFASSSDSTTWEAMKQVYFSSPQMSDYLQYAHNNSFYHATAAATTQSTTLTTGIANDPEVIITGSTIFTILFCEASFYDVTYNRVNGTVTSYHKIPSNSSLANVFMTGVAFASFGTSNLQNAITQATATATSAQDLADQYATALTKTILSVGAGSVMQSSAVAVQERTSVLVAKVLKAPLYLLIMTNLSFVIMGIALSVIAAMTSREAHEIQGRLSIEGLVANMFEGERAKRPSEAVQRLFGEYWERDCGHATRVGIEQTSVGGYAFKVVSGQAHDVLCNEKV